MSPSDVSPPDGDKQDKRNGGHSLPTVMRFATLGTELAGYALGLGGIGYLVDWYREHPKPYATACMTLVGFTYGMYRFVAEVQKATK